MSKPLATTQYSCCIHLIQWLCSLSINIDLASITSIEGKNICAYKIGFQINVINAANAIKFQTNFRNPTVFKVLYRYIFFFVKFGIPFMNTDGHMTTVQFNLWTLATS